MPVHYGHMSDSSKVILENSVLDMLKDSTIQSKEVTALDGSAMALLIVSERDTMFIFQQEPFQPKLEKLLNHLFLLDFQKDSICTLDLNNWKTWQEVMPPPSAPIGTKQIVFGE